MCVVVVAPQLTDRSDGVTDCIRLHAVRHLVMVVHGVGVHGRAQMSRKVRACTFELLPRSHALAGVVGSS